MSKDELQIPDWVLIDLRVELERSAEVIDCLMKAQPGATITIEERK